MRNEFRKPREGTRKTEKNHKCICHPELVSASHQCWAKSSDFVRKLVRYRNKFGMTPSFKKIKTKPLQSSHSARFGWFPIKAFTLAEVLITLAIIGIIATITIPNLISKYEEQATISKVKKFYSNINNAFKLAMNENGTLDTWDIQTSSDLTKPIISHLKVQKDCGTILNSGCIPNEMYYLNGNYALNYDTKSREYYKFILEDSSTVWARKDGSCTTSSDCGIMWYDTNGKKKPNTLGKDIFHFYIYRNKITPCCGGPTDCKKNDNGWSCAYHIILNSNMDYLH